MEAADYIALAGWVVSVVLAIYAVRQARSAAASVSLMQEQVDVMVRTEEREVAEQRAEELARRSADVQVDSETSRIPATAERAIVVRNLGLARGRSVALEIIATSQGEVNVLEGGSTSFLRRGQLQPGEVWAIPLVFPDGAEGVPYEIRLAWEDDAGRHESRPRVETHGPNRVDAP